MPFEISTASNSLFILIENFSGLSAAKSESVTKYCCVSQSRKEQNPFLGSGINSIEPESDAKANISFLSKKPMEFGSSNSF